MKLSFLALLLITILSCKKEGPLRTDWTRESEPIFRDFISGENYEVASDPHVFIDENGSLKMIYTGDVNGHPGIKLASGNSLTEWQTELILLDSVGPSGLDIGKETCFYRKANNGKHQIYYIGYPDESSYEAQIYLADADNLEGPYTQMSIPVISKGIIAGKKVYTMTSPSIVEHNGNLYMAFIGWDNNPSSVTEVWTLGAISNDDGYTWSEFQEIETRIGMEGQLTKGNDGQFYSVRTGDYKKGEGIFLASSEDPFMDWEEEKKPILFQAGEPYEKDVIIAPQLFFDPSSGKRVLYYTGGDFAKGWWIMMARE